MMECVNSQGPTTSTEAQNNNSFSPPAVTTGFAKESNTAGNLYSLQSLLDYKQQLDNEIKQDDHLKSTPSVAEVQGKLWAVALEKILVFVEGAVDVLDSVSATVSLFDKARSKLVVQLQEPEDLGPASLALLPATTIANACYCSGKSFLSDNVIAAPILDKGTARPLGVLELNSQPNFKFTAEHEWHASVICRMIAQVLFDTNHQLKIYVDLENLKKTRRARIPRPPKRAKQTVQKDS